MQGEILLTYPYHMLTGPPQKSSGLGSSGCLAIAPLGTGKWMGYCGAVLKGTAPESDCLGWNLVLTLTTCSKFLTSNLIYL